MSQLENLKLRGSKLDELTLRRIFEIYNNAVGGQADVDESLFPLGYYLNMIQEDLLTKGRSEWRFGSSLSGDSKLFLEQDSEGNMTIGFSPNVIQTGESGQLIETFNSNIQAYLKKEGIGTVKQV